MVILARRLTAAGQGRPSAGAQSYLGERTLDLCLIQAFMYRSTYSILFIRVIMESADWLALLYRSVVLSFAVPGSAPAGRR